MPLAEEMVARGHQVTVVMPYPTKTPNPKIKEIIVDGKEWDAMQKKMSDEKLNDDAGAMPPVHELVENALLVSNDNQYYRCVITFSSFKNTISAPPLILTYMTLYINFS